ncbi:MAG: aminodeoxychorismate lyase [Acidobacteria bacterium]|jgi:4-amino-4-deoxychorismate lyase|nr:MAG: aminodeoxychorismate lyase [Acidobacteriota bacterium]
MPNRTLLFGEGLFETIRWRPKEEKLKLHYQRLSSSADYLGIPCPSYEEFKKALEKATLGCDELYVKYLLISKGKKALTDRPEGYKGLIIKGILGPQPERVRLIFSSFRRHSSDPVCRHKTTSYLFNLMVKKEAKAKGMYDGLILNEKEELCETSTANLLLLKGSRLYTPAKECGLLWGTTLELLSKRMDIKEERIKLRDMEKCDSIFVLNSLLLCSGVEGIGDESRAVDGEALREILKVLSQ